MSIAKRVIGRMTGGASGLNSVAKGLVERYGKLVNAGSNTAEEQTSLNKYLYENNVLPQQICALDSAKDLAADEHCLFTSEDELNALAKVFDANQHSDIQTWYRPKWKDVPADLPHIIKYEESSGPTQDLVKCTKANHKELSKRRSNALQNIRASYVTYLRDTALVEFDEECIKQGLDRNVERAKHAVLGRARIGVGTDKPSILTQVADKTVKNKPFTKLAKAIKAEQAVLVKLVGLGQSGETTPDTPLEELSDDSGARLCEDDIRDLVTKDMLEALEQRRDANVAFERALIAMDLDDMVQQEIGMYISKLK